MTQLPHFTITQLRLDGYYWRARVTVNGQSVEVERGAGIRGGGWQAIVRNGPKRRTFHRENVHPQVAARLQEKVRPLEKKQPVSRAT